MTITEYYQSATGSKAQRGGTTITQADSDLTDVLLELHTFAAGDVKVSWGNGNSATITVPAGQSIILGPITRVWDTGTTLTNAQMVGYV